MIYVTLAIFLFSMPEPETESPILFSKHQVLKADIDTVEIWLRANWEKGVQIAPTYVVRRTTSHRQDMELPKKWLAQKTVLWADNNSCPQFLDQLEALNQLPSPIVFVGAVPSEEVYGSTVRADGAIYRLVVPASYPTEEGQADWVFPADNPLAEWIDESFRVLAPCWKEAIPERAADF